MQMQAQGYDPAAMQQWTQQHAAWAQQQAGGGDAGGGADDQAAAQAQHAAQQAAQQQAQVRPIGLSPRLPSTRLDFYKDSLRPDTQGLIDRIPI
jgi:hypothetical protein